MKILLVGAEMFHVTDGQAGMTQLIVVFRNFAKVPKWAYKEYI